MKSEDKIRDTFGTDPGFKEPDGYFDQVFARIESQLPELSEPSIPKRLSTWQRIKPYVYLAAMFGGIWCTMKMVHMISSQQPAEISLDNPPAMVAQAMGDPEIAAQICPSTSVMIVEEDVSEPSAEDSGDVSSDMDTTEDNPEVSDNYEEFVEISDIDINQLRAALDIDDSSEDLYYI